MSYARETKYGSTGLLHLEVNVPLKQEIDFSTPFELQRYLLSIVAKKAFSWNSSLSKILVDNAPEAEYPFHLNHDHE